VCSSDLTIERFCIYGLMALSLYNNNIIIIIIIIIEKRQRLLNCGLWMTL